MTRCSAWHCFDFCFVKTQSIEVTVFHHMWYNMPNVVQPDAVKPAIKTANRQQPVSRLLVTMHDDTRQTPDTGWHQCICRISNYHRLIAVVTSSAANKQGIHDSCRCLYISTLHWLWKRPRSTRVMNCADVISLPLPVWTKTRRVAERP